MKTIVVIPTYDEKDNVRPMAEAVLNCGADGVEILFVDDNSPDGTGKILDEMASADPRVHVLHRVKKEGLGRAYVAGFTEAIRLGADNVIQMDCDFSHDPKDVPPTGGFKRWKKSALEKINYVEVGSADCSFQLEMNHRAWKAGFPSRKSRSSSPSGGRATRRLHSASRSNRSRWLCD